MANLNEEKKYHFIYKTTNLKNDKFYVGMHSTNKLDDGYLGSGIRLRRSIRKNGKENFKLEILEFLPDRSSLVEREKQLVNESLLKDPMCMNMCVGGKGGFISVDGYRKGAKRMNEIVWANPEYRKKKSEWKSEHNIKLWKEGKLKTNPWPKGKPLSDETKRKIGEANSVKQRGSSNSQFDTCWITNGIENKKIKKTDLIPNGWKNGRIVNMRK
jgi:Zn-finger domain-containing protein